MSNEDKVRIPSGGLLAGFVTFRLYRPKGPEGEITLDPTRVRGFGCGSPDNRWITCDWGDRSDTYQVCETMDVIRARLEGVTK